MWPAWVGIANQKSKPGDPLTYLAATGLLFGTDTSGGVIYAYLCCSGRSRLFVLCASSRSRRVLRAACASRRSGHLTMPAKVSRARLMSLSTRDGEFITKGV